jgi:hypothetical protein
VKDSVTRAEAGKGTVKFVQGNYRENKGLTSWVLRWIKRRMYVVLIVVSLGTVTLLQRYSSKP